MANFLAIYLQTSLEEKNTKPFYRYIKAQKNDNFGISSLKFNGLMYSDSSSKSEILNKQFQSGFTKKAPQLLLDCSAINIHQSETYLLL